MCLRQSFLPGSHKRKTITKRFVRLPQGGTGFVDLPDAQDEAATDWEQELGWKQECCNAGDLVLIHGKHQASEKGCLLRIRLRVLPRGSATSVPP